MSVPTPKPASKGCLGFLFPGAKPKPLNNRIGVGKERILMASDRQVIVWR